MSIATPSGYALTRDFFGAVTAQGPLKLVTLSLPWDVLIDLVVAPDPERKSDYNRPLTVPHAKRFGQYLDRTKDPFTPPVSLFTDPDFVLFESLGERTLDQFGLRIVKIKRNAPVFILDGQHRIFGVMKLAEEYDKAYRKNKELLSKSKRNGSDREVLVHFEKKLKDIERSQDRLTRSQVTAQILLTSRGTQAKRIFADVSNNAKGISQSLRADFSDRNVFHRVAKAISQSTLDGLVDHVHDRLSKKNPNWLSLKDVVNVSQAMLLDIGQRWTIKREDFLKEKEGQIEAMTRSFFEGLFNHFEELQQLRAATIVGYDLRAGGKEVSLLGSAPIIRALAIAYGRLRRGDGGHPLMSNAEAFAVWSSALPPMTAGHKPHESGEPEMAESLIHPVWMGTELFKYPYVAPATARMGDLGYLANLIVVITRRALEQREPVVLNSRPTGASKQKAGR